MNEPTNADRAGWAKAALETYSSLVKGDDDGETLLSDLLTDLRHYAAAEEMDFGRALDTSLMHFEDETKDGEHLADLEHYVAADQIDVAAGHLSARDYYAEDEEAEPDPTPGSGKENPHDHEV